MIKLEPSKAVTAGDITKDIGTILLTCGVFLLFLQLAELSPIFSGQLIMVGATIYLVGRYVSSKYAQAPSTEIDFSFKSKEPEQKSGSV